MKEKRRYVWFEDIDGVILCPNCEKQLSDLYHEVCGEVEGIEAEYCPYCGQHLSWAKTAYYGSKEGPREEDNNIAEE